MASTDTASDLPPRLPTHRPVLSRPSPAFARSAAGMRRVAGFVEGPGRVVVLLVIVLMFVRVFLN